MSSLYRGSFSGLPSSLGIQDASAPSYFATTLAVTIFQQRSMVFRWFFWWEEVEPKGHLFTELFLRRMK